MSFDRKLVPVAAFFHILWYDSFFYAGVALLVLIYGFFVETIFPNMPIAILFSLLLLGCIALLWLWNTSLLLAYFGKKKGKLWVRKALVLALGFGSILALLIGMANAVISNLLTLLVDAQVTLIVSSLVISLLLLGIFIPACVLAVAYFHAKLIEWFFSEKVLFRKKLPWCIIVFSCTSIIALALKFLPEEMELVLSGTLLIFYFAWQKAYLLAK